jgi:hypothetical protein
MALKLKFKSKDEIPADQQALYVERDGAWTLDVDGAADKAKLDEFRAHRAGGIGSKCLRRWRQAAKAPCTCATAAMNLGSDLVLVFAAIVWRRKDHRLG